MAVMWTSIYARGSPVAVVAFSLSPRALELWDFAEAFAEESRSAQPQGGSPFPRIPTGVPVVCFRSQAEIYLHDATPDPENKHEVPWPPARDLIFTPTKSAVTAASKAS